MHTFSLTFRRSAGLAAGALLILAGLNARAEDKTPSKDDFPNFDSYIKITGQTASVTGNESSFKRGTQQSKNGAGIEEFRYVKEANDTTITSEGRALAGAEDYLASVKVAKTDVGTFDIGYKRFRTFYDGIGGFFPVNSNWMALNNPELATDRAAFWVNMTVARPDQPVFTLSYRNELRNGRKDTTIWGDTDYTGIPIWSQSSLNPVSANRKIVPAYIDLAERQQTLEASMKHTAGKTTYELNVIANHINMFDTRYMNRYPGEVKPYPAIPSTPATLVSPSLANNQVSGYDSQGLKSDTVTVEGKIETEINDQISIFVGASYQDIEANISGDREMTQWMQTATGLKTAVGGFITNGRPPYSYTATGGYNNGSLTTGNAGVNYAPSKDLKVTFALKAEKSKYDGSNSANYISTYINQTTGALTAINTSAANTGNYKETVWTPELNVKYTGIKGATLYGTFDYRYSPADEVVSSGGVSPSGTTVVSSVSSGSNNVKVNHGHYVLGGTYTVSPMVTLRAETFYKDHKNAFNGFGADAGSRYVLGYQFYGTKLSATVKPLATLSATTRIIAQKGKMDTTVDAGSSYDSMDSKNYSIGESVDWNPANNLYVQGSVNYVFNTLQTAYPRAGGTGNDVLHNSDNNYWNGTLLFGYIVDESTDAQVQYTITRADNYVPAPTATQPYGAGFKDYSLTVGLKHKFSDRMIGSVKIGYFNGTNDTTGGNTNYRGTVGYVTLEHAL